MMKWIKDAFNWVKGLINSWYNSIYFWMKRNEAMRLHRLTGRRYHVIPNRGKLIVVDNRYVNFINKNLPKQRRITIKHLLEWSYYSTPTEGIIRPSLKKK